MSSYDRVNETVNLNVKEGIRPHHTSRAKVQTVSKSTSIEGYMTVRVRIGTHTYFCRRLGKGDPTGNITVKITGEDKIKPT